MGEVLFRTAGSLIVVVGLVVMLARLVQWGGRARGNVDVQVRHRQSLTRGAGVHIVEVGERVFLLGVTEQAVSLLTELDPSDIAESTPAEAIAEETEETEAPSFAAELVARTARPAAASHRAESRRTASRGAESRRTASRGAESRRTASRRTEPRRTELRGGSALEGSILSVGTWRQAARMLGGRTT